MVDSKKALESVQAAQHALRLLYLNDPDDETAVATADVPAHLRDLAEYLRQASEWLAGGPIPWDRQVVEVTADGPIQRWQLRSD